MSAAGPPIPGLERLVEELERMILAKVQVMLDGYRPSGRAAVRFSGGAHGPPGPMGPPGAAAGGDTLLDAGDCHPPGSIQALVDELYCAVSAIQSQLPAGFGNGGFGAIPFGS